MLQSISTLETSVAVRAMIPKREGQPHVQSETLTLPFLPAFYVHNPELQLNNVLPTASLRISATEKVAAEIKVCDVTFLSTTQEVGAGNTVITMAGPASVRPCFVF